MLLVSQFLSSFAIYYLYLYILLYDCKYLCNSALYVQYVAAMSFFNKQSYITLGLQSPMGCILPNMHCRSQQCWELLRPFKCSYIYYGWIGPEGVILKRMACIVHASSSYFCGPSLQSIYENFSVSETYSTLIFH